jgi:hypothetical protein
MALTFTADAEVFLDINVHNNNIFFVFLDFLQLSLAVAAALSYVYGPFGGSQKWTISTRHGIPTQNKRTYRLIGMAPPSLVDHTLQIT